MVDIYVEMASLDSCDREAEGGHREWLPKHRVQLRRQVASDVKPAASRRSV